MRYRSSWILVLTVALLSALPARAVIMVLIPLKDLAEKEDLIFVAKVKEVLPDKPAMVLVPDENIKGKAPFERMPINLTGDNEAKKGKHTEAMLDRIDKDVPIVVIVSKTDGKYIAFGFTEGTWFQMQGRVEKQDGAEVVRWTFLHCEPYLRRTFKGTTEELKQVLADAVAKKKEPPAPDVKEKPGLGPAIKKNSGLDRLAANRRVSGDSRETQGCGDRINVLSQSSRESPETLRFAAKQSTVFPVIGVIQLPFLGLIAALAALFPAVFGGLALFMKRWVAALSTSGIVSMFVALPLVAPAWSARQWIYSPSGLWISCGLLFSVGALWSARRYRLSLDRGDGEIMQPRRMDRIVVPLLALAGLTSLAIGVQLSLPLWTTEAWRWVLAGTVAFIASGYYLLTTHARTRLLNPTPVLRISTETLLLWGLAGCCAVYGAWEAGRLTHQFMTGSGGLGQPSLSPDNAVIWKFEPDLGGMVVNSCATDERIYVAVFAMPKPTSQSGRIYALDSKTGAELWRFPNAKLLEKDPDFSMKPAFSAPVYADGRLYIGEGLHQHEDSRLFCLDAATGDLLWQYQTDSHTESTPVVAEGKVVFGAGYHGIHCVDAVKGDLLWRFPKDAKAADKSLHVDSSPFIADGCVYAGSGYKPDYVKNDGKINTIFCLDLRTGEPKWQQRIEDAVYGSLLVRDGRVYHGTGNSTYSESFPSKRPGVICRDAKTGDEIWYCQLPETVLARPAADRYQLYVGCVNGDAYALDRTTGKIAWQAKIDSAIYADPVMDLDKQSGLADVIYFAGKSGSLAALSPYSSNRTFWSINLNYWTNSEIDQTATPTLLRVEDDRSVQRRLFLGFCQGRLGSGATRLYCVEDRANK